VGCGLGYLGTLYWPFFGRGGKYCGVDVSTKLATQAKKLSLHWAKGGKTEFKTGDAYKLPYPDNYADVVMCQTLLIHLSDAQKAINEMFRILKPGGVVLCKEPDNLSMSLQHTITSLPELPLEDELFFQKVAFISNKGNAALGLGYYNAAPRVPLWLKEAGFKKIDARINSYLMLGIPPYETEKQKYAIEYRQKLQKLYDTPNEKRKDNYEFKKIFFAGGGNRSDYVKYMKLKRKYKPRNDLYKQQVKDGTAYWFCSSQFFAIKGSKPK